MVRSLALALLLSLPAGAAQEKQTLTIWWAAWDPAVALQKLATGFDKDVDVKVVQIPWSDFQTKTQLEFGKERTDFDIVVGDSQWMGQGARKKWYLDLTDWLPKAVDLKSIHPKALRYLAEYPPGSGRYFGVPCYFDALVVAYRRDWFEDGKERAAYKDKHGRDLRVPETWEELQTIARFFTRPESGRYGFATLTGRGYDALVMGFTPFLHAFGGSWGDEATCTAKGRVNSAGAVAGLRFFKELLECSPKGGTMLDYVQTMEVFTNGTTAMSMNFLAFAPFIRKAMGERADFFILPRKGTTRAVTLGGQSFNISAKVSEERQALAKKFMAWFHTPEVQKKWAEAPSCFPTQATTLASGDYRGRGPIEKAMSDSAAHGVDFWNVPEANELLMHAMKHLGDALDGRLDAKAALDAIAEEHEKILKEEAKLRDF